jgi:hypothetical protein
MIKKTTIEQFRKANNKKADEQSRVMIEAILQPFIEWAFGTTPEGAKAIIDKYFKQKPPK